MIKKDVIVGLGEIGRPILKLLSKSGIVVGYDINERLMNKKKFEKYTKINTSFLHICIPFSTKFTAQVESLFNQFHPECIVIHSTIRPHTTEILQKRFPIPIIYSATRGIHRRMLYDMKRYTKFFSVYQKAQRSRWAIQQFTKKMKKVGIKTRKLSTPLVLELAKIIVDTSYYGWLISYAQLSKMIAIENKVDYDEMWSFADEIHKLLGNRPKMYPGFIGGHCVIPNLDLVHNQTLNLIKEINAGYIKKVPKAKFISKKYDKSKKQSYTK